MPRIYNPIRNYSNDFRTPRLLVPFKFRTGLQPTIRKRVWTALTKNRPCLFMCHNKRKSAVQTL